MNNDYQLYDHGISRPSGPKKRACLPRMNEQKNPIESSLANMAGKKKAKQNVSNDSLNSTGNSSLNFSPSSHGTPDGNLRRRTGIRQSPSIYPSLPESETSEIGTLPEISGISNKSDLFDFSENPNDTTDRSRHTSDESFSPENISDSSNQSNKKSKRAETHNNKQSFSILSLFIVIPIVLAIVFACIYNFGDGQTHEDINEEEILNLKSEIMALKNLFPSQDKNIWRQFSSGIADVKSNNHTPAIFLLLTNDTETTSCLAKRVAEVARSALHGTGNVFLTPDQLKNDINDAFDVMEKQMKQTKAVVVLDILNIQPEAMKAFHDICDEYSSLVQKAVYVLTMRQCEQYEESKKKFVSCAEQQMKTKFSNDIINDTLDALIVRITAGAVFDIKAEESIPCSAEESA